MLISKISVYLNSAYKQKLGTLAIKNRKIYFEYDSVFIKTGIEISPYKLPLKADLQVCDESLFDGLWGVFDDSLADGWGRLLMDRHLMGLGINHAEISPLDRLSYIGDFGMGALSYEPVREDKKALIADIVLDDLAESSQVILRGSSETLLDELLNLNASSAGARPKVMVQMGDNGKEIIHGSQSLKDGFSHWMVKFASASDSVDIGAIEYAYSLMAKEAGLDMPKTLLLEGEKGRYFACKRFDRVGNKRVHMHSVAGMVHADFRLPCLDYDDLMVLTIHLTKNVQELEKMFRLACFNLFSHNRDDHAKNFSFVLNEQGVWALSPVYDLTFSSGPGGEHSTMYLGEGKRPTQVHLQRLGQKHGIKTTEIIISEVKSAIDNWSKFAIKSNLSVTMSKNIEQHLNGLIE